MAALVSIIVPVYNAGQYLPQCIESILEQNLTNLELILIDDGSADGSGAICDGYARQDQRVRVIHQENMGLCNARNEGLQLADGEYITFVDADDWIEPGMYHDLLDLQKRSDADIVMCSYYVFFEDTSQANILGWNDGTVLEEKEIKEKLIPSLISPIDLDGKPQTIEMGFVWRTVYRRDFLQKHQLSFDPAIKYSEDLAFTVKGFSQADRIAISRYPYYHYRQHAKYKTSMTVKYMPDKYQHRLLCNQQIACILDKLHYSERMQKQMDWRICLNVINSLNNLCNPDCPLGWCEKVKQARYYVNDSCFSQRAARVDSQYFTSTQKIAIFLLRNSLINTALFAYTLKNRLK